MSGVLRSALTAPRAARLWPTPISFFHSTPAMERRRSNYWQPRFNYYAKRRRKMESKKTLVRNLSEYAEYLFQSWRDEEEQNSSVHEMPWFRRHYYAHGATKKGFREPQSENYRIKRNEAFEFCSASDDDDDVETMFRSFGGERLRFSYWSFNSSQNFQRSSRNWRYENYDENDVSPPHEFTSERIALGLKASGPLNLEDVKKAYRSCALKWHPDRHQGSSKLAAEEKFKHCSAAYKVLCDNLAG